MNFGKGIGSRAGSDYLRTATTRDMRKLLNWLEEQTEPVGVTVMKDETGVSTIKCGDAMLFLGGLGVVKKDKLKFSAQRQRWEKGTAKVYWLNDGRFLDFPVGS